MKSRALLIAWLALSAARLASAQLNTPIQLQTDVTPSFNITPLVHHFEAPRGKLLEFDFQIEAVGRPASLEIKPVGLRQQENGVILPAEDAPLAESVQLLTPQAFVLASGEASLIRGRIRVPHSNSNFHSFGILVRDLGRPVEDSANADTEQTRIGINFVTQYLLRCDVSVTGARSDDIRRLELSNGEVAEIQGRPQARVWVFNPTDSHLEFQARCWIANPQTASRKRYFDLALPVRASLDEAERRNSRILPDSLVRLEAFLPEPLFPGDWILEVELRALGRSQLQRPFPVVVGEDDFPAQHATFLFLSPQVRLQPAQIDLSVRPQGRRSTVLNFVNEGSEEVNLQLSVEPQDGFGKEWVVIRPSDLTLSGQSSRSIWISVAGSSNPPANLYGNLNVHLQSPSGAQRSRSLPLAVLARVEDDPRLSVVDVGWAGTGSRPAIVVSLKNEGNVHLPLDGKLTLSDSQRRNVELHGGFGRWLLPGENGELRFLLPGPAPPSQYRIHLEIYTGAEREPVALEGSLPVDAAAATTAARDHDS